jgi:hypothetical protein
MSKRGPAVARIGDGAAISGSEIDAMRPSLEVAIGQSIPDQAWSEIYRNLLSFYSDMSIAQSLNLREYEETAETLFQKLADVLGSVEDFANGIENRHITLEPLANAIVAAMADLKQRNAEWLPYTVNGQKEYRKMPMPNQVISESDAKNRVAKRLYEIACQYDLNAKKLVFAAKIHPQQSEEAWAKWYQRTVKGT